MSIGSYVAIFFVVRLLRSMIIPTRTKVVANAKILATITGVAPRETETINHELAVMIDNVQVINETAVLPVVR